jgi:hypothetical protein
MAIARCGINPGRVALARRAADWTRAFHPDVTVALARGQTTLTSQQRSATELRLIWRTALVNERLLDAGVEQRAATLAALVA